MNTVDQSSATYMKTFLEHTKILSVEACQQGKPGINVLSKKYEPKGNNNFGGLYSVETQYFVITNGSLEELEKNPDKTVADLIDLKKSSVIIELITEFLNRENKRYFVTTYILS